MIRCDSCNVSFTSNKGLYQHMKGKRHTDRINGTSPVLHHACSCGKSYSHRQSLFVHKMSCTIIDPPVTSVTEIIEDLKNTVLEERKIHQYEREQIKLDIYEKNARIDTIQQQINEYKKEQKQMKDKIAAIVHNTNSTTTQCVITELQPQKSRDKRKKINKIVRQQVVNKQGNTCGVCTLALTPYFEIDHIIGLQFGGTDDELNLMALCRECHAKKSIKENQCREQIKDAIQIIFRENFGIGQRV